MIGSSTYLSLPRPVGIITMLSGFAAVLWLVWCTVLIVQAMVFESELNVRLTGAQRYALRVRQQLTTDAPEDLQSTLEQIR